MIEIIAKDNVINTNDPESLRKYNDNVSELVRRLKEKGSLDNYAIIRNDSIFPRDYVWHINSKNTYAEYNILPISYEIRRYMAEVNAHIDNDFPFPIPGNEKKINDELSKLPKTVGKVLLPTKYRTTKHFTLNTPLGFTGEYNNVSSTRDFTIIDSIDNFLNSGYGYTIAARDTYLDVAHEGLKISKNAIILVSKEKMESLKEDPELLSILNQRRVVIYEGNIDLAINMVLSENGILPTRPGNRIEYDQETFRLIEESIKNLASINNIPYSIGHGNMFGHGGHFSDLIDGENKDFQNAVVSFINYLNTHVNSKIKLSPKSMSNSDELRRFIKEVGPEVLLGVIDEYNKNMELEMSNRFKKYVDDRETITDEIRKQFQLTLDLIGIYFKNEERDREVNNLIQIFFYSDTVLEQVNASNKLIELLSKKDSFKM